MERPPREAPRHARGATRRGPGRDHSESASALDRLERIGFRAIEAAAWPRLLTLPDPPRVLFQRGNLSPGSAALAIVGARRATGYGLRVTESLARGVASGRRRGAERPRARNRRAGAPRGARGRRIRPWPCSAAAPTRLPARARDAAGADRAGGDRHHRIPAGHASAAAALSEAKPDPRRAGRRRAGHRGAEEVGDPDVGRLGGRSRPRGPRRARTDRQPAFGRPDRPACGKERRRSVRRPRPRGSRPRPGRRPGARAAGPGPLSEPERGSSRSSPGARSTSTSSCRRRGRRRRGSWRSCCRSRLAECWSAKPTGARSEGRVRPLTESGGRRTMNSEKKCRPAQTSARYTTCRPKLRRPCRMTSSRSGRPGAAETSSRTRKAGRKRPIVAQRLMTPSARAASARAR